MRRVAVSTIVLVLCTFGGSFVHVLNAQVRSTHRKAQGGQLSEDTPEAWQQRTEQVLADLLTVKSQLDEDSKLVLPARLCAAYFTVDIERARGWCLEALEKVSYTPQNETESSRQHRMAMARALLQIIGGLDRHYREWLEGVLNEGVRGAARDDRPLVASALASAAASSVVSPAADRAEMLNHANDLAVTMSGIRAIIALNGSDPTRAGQLLQSTIARIEASADPASYVALTQTIFPVGVTNSPMVPSAWREQTIKALANYVTTVLDTKTRTGDRCPPEIVSETRRLQSQLTDAARASMAPVLQRCQQVSVAKQTSPQPAGPNPRTLNTTDDWLNAAQQVSVPGYRAQYKLNAAMHAARDDRDFERALTIYDEMTKEERKGLPVEVLRYEVAIRAAVLLWKNGEHDRALKILDQFQPGTELSGYLDVFEQLSVSQGSAANVLLDIARTKLTVYSENPGSYVRIINLYGRTFPEIVPEVLRPALESLANWQPHSKEEVDAGGTYYSPLDHNLQPLRLEPKIATLDADLLTATAKALPSDGIRASVDLFLLHSWLQRMESARRLKTTK